MYLNHVSWVHKNQFFFRDMAKTGSTSNHHLSTTSRPLRMIFDLKKSYMSTWKVLYSLISLSKRTWILGDIIFAAPNFFFRTVISPLINELGRWTPTLAINKNKKPQKGHERPDGWTDGHIILPLRGFEPVARGRMRCMQCRATLINFYCQFKFVFQTKPPI